MCVSILLLQCCCPNGSHCLLLAGQVPPPYKSSEWRRTPRRCHACALAAGGPQRVAQALDSEHIVHQLHKRQDKGRKQVSATICAWGSTAPASPHHPATHVRGRDGCQGIQLEHVAGMILDDLHRRAGRQELVAHLRRVLAALPSGRADREQPQGSLAAMAALRASSGCRAAGAGSERTLAERASRHTPWGGR